MAHKVLGVYVGQSLYSTLTPSPKNYGRSKFFIIFFTFGFTKFKPMVLKIETLLTSQNLTKELLVVCSEVQKFGVVKTYLGIVTSQIDPPDFLPNFPKIVIYSRDGPESSTCVCGPMFRIFTTLNRDTYATAPTPLNFLGVVNIFVMFLLFAQQCSYPFFLK